MITTFDHLGGVGIHARWAVLREGRRIGFIDRHSSQRGGWHIEGHYGRTIKDTDGRECICRTLDATKRWAETLRFPTAAQVYEEICAEVEGARREHLIALSAQTFARLAREMLGGSNSARDDMANLLDEIERLAKDRDASTKAPWDGAGFNPNREIFRGQPLASRCATYPKPPESRALHAYVAMTDEVAA